MDTKIKFFVFLLLFWIPLETINSTAVCVGYECGQISNQTLLGANLLDPVLDEIYTKEFLNSMAGSAVLQNINAAMMGGKIIEKNRIGIGYGASRSDIKPRDFYFQFTELNELPTQGIAASPSLSYAVNLGHLLDRGGNWRKWNLFAQYFPYLISEKNLPFVKIRNTDVDGRISNSSLNVRYFPFFDLANGDTKNGLSIGLGFYQTKQDISLFSYDRRPTQFRVDGDTRRWLGTNSLEYNSLIYSFTSDIRYSIGISRFLVFAGIGMMYNSGRTNVRVERIALITSSVNRDDFSSNPSGVLLDISKRNNISDFNFYGSMGFQYNWDSVGLSLEYLRNRNTESLNFGVHTYF